MKKDISIEVIRIFASFFVVCIHTFMNYRMIDHRYNEQVLFMETFTRCAVPIFFMITGFVLFPIRKKLTAVWKGFYFRILIPTMAIVVVLEFFHPFIHHEKNLIENILGGGSIDVKSIVGSLIEFDASGWKDGFYLWYIFELVKIYFYIPILDILCREDEKSAKARRYMITVTAFLALIIPFSNSLFQLNYNFPIEVPIDMASWYVLVGFEMKLWMKRNENKDNKPVRKAWLWILLYILACISMFFLTVSVDIKRDMEFNELFWSWHCLLPAISSIAFFLCIYMITNKSKFIMSKQRIFLYLGKASFGVYLIHYIIINMTASYGIAYKLYERIQVHSVFLLAVINYVISVCVIIFFIFMKEKVKAQFWSIGKKSKYDK